MDFVCRDMFFSAPFSFHFVQSPSPCIAVLLDLGGVDSAVHPCLTLGAKCFNFFLVLPFPTLADRSCPLPDINS